jgi:hypothetical protein
MDSFYLTARPSFLSGAARVLDMFGMFDSYNYSLSGPQADEIALRQDMAVLARDVRIAIERFKAEVEAGEHPRQPRLFDGQ